MGLQDGSGGSGSTTGADSTKLVGRPGTLGGVGSKDRKKRRRAKRARGGDPSKRPQVQFAASVKRSALWVLAAMALYGLAHLLTHGGGGGTPPDGRGAVVGDLFAMGLVGTVLAVMMTSTSLSVQRRGVLCAALTLVVALVMHQGTCPRAGCLWVLGGTPAGTPAAPAGEPPR